MDIDIYIDGEVIPSVVEKPVKSLGKWYNSTLLRLSVHKIFLPGKLKRWCLELGLFPCMQRWPLTVYEVAISEVEKFVRIMNKAVRRWLGVPCCLSTIALYGKGILELPMTSLVEDIKCVWILETTLSQSKDPAVKNTGKTWIP